MYIVNAFWTIAAGNEAAAHTALASLADDIERHEPDTWMYLVHDPNVDKGINTFPPPGPGQIAFIEGYKNRAALAAHAARLAGFLAQNGKLFLNMYGPTSPFMMVQGLLRDDGFIRRSAADPGVFQVIARWVTKPGHALRVKAALVDYVKAVRDTEPKTCMYTANVPDLSIDSPSMPPLSPDRLIYNSSWTDHDAFVEHTKGAPYQDFLAAHGDLFVQVPGSRTHTQPYMTTAVLKRFAGFFRDQAFCD